MMRWMKLGKTSRFFFPFWIMRPIKCKSLTNNGVLSFILLFITLKDREEEKNSHTKWKIRYFLWIILCALDQICAFFCLLIFYWSLFFLLIALEHQVDTWKSLKLMSRAFESTLLLSHYKIRETSCMMIFNLLSAMKITDEKNVNDALLSGSMMLFHFRLNNIPFIRTGLWLQLHLYINCYRDFHI